MRLEEEVNYLDDSNLSAANLVDVKEAIRCSISLKSKLQPVTHHSLTMAMSTASNYSEKSPELSDLEDELERSTFPKKSRKKQGPEDEETVAVRRERNRLAAQRCRQRRRDRIDKLERICQRLENDGGKLECEIHELQNEMKELQRVLSGHKCNVDPLKYIQHTAGASTTAPVTKTEIYLPNI